VIRTTRDRSTVRRAGRTLLLTVVVVIVAPVVVAALLVISLYAVQLVCELIYELTH
jgi:hypothetical protein